MRSRWNWELGDRKTLRNERGWYRRDFTQDDFPNGGSIVRMRNWRFLEIEVCRDMMYLQSQRNNVPEKG
jgi:hypothetical protein